MKKLLVIGFILFGLRDAPAQDVSQDSPARPGDVIVLRVWREPDLSGEFPVDEEGFVTLPKVGPVPTADRPYGELKQQIFEAFQEFLRNPSIEIGIRRRISILGQVRNPGVYMVDPTSSLPSVLALAGGPTPAADREKVVIVRGDQRLEVRVDPGFPGTLPAIHSNDQIFIPERGWFTRHWRTVLTTVVGLAGLYRVLSK